MSMRVLFLGAHPDDEAIGCGGTLAHHVIEGDVVRVVFVTSGEKGGHGIDDAGAVREREARAAAAILGLEDIVFWHEPDGALHATAALVERIAEELTAFRPDRVYVHPMKDMHPDHRAVARALRQALGRLNGSAPPVRVFAYEVWTPLTEIDLVVDVSDVIERKLEAIRAYESQCRVMRFDEASLGLMRWRGEMHSWPGGEYAEVFSKVTER
jgi:LmbE family N-acetylglucosaminyl deacetylase